LTTDARLNSAPTERNGRNCAKAIVVKVTYRVGKYTGTVWDAEID